MLVVQNIQTRAQSRSRTVDLQWRAGQCFPGYDSPKRHNLTDLTRNSSGEIIHWPRDVLVSSLLCHSCTSKVTWDECLQQEQSQVFCSGADQCLKLQYERSSGGNIYKKGCAVSTQCSSATRPECKTSGSHKRCDVFCCSEELCNDSFVILESKFGMTISLLVSYFTTYFIAYGL